MTRLYLLRHGETAWNAAGNRYCGQTDLSLADAGRAQAGAAAAALADVPLAAVYVSTLARSREMGEIIAAARSLPVIADPRLREIDFGAWEGLTAAEIALRDPQGWAAWRRHPDTVRAGDTGETGREVSERMKACLDEIAAAHRGSSLAIVGHNTALRLYLVATLGAPLAYYRRMALHNGGLSVLELAEGEARWVRLNDVSHLAGLSESN